MLFGPYEMKGESPLPGSAISGVKLALTKKKHGQHEPFCPHAAPTFLIAHVFTAIHLESDYFHYRVFIDGQIHPQPSA